MKIIAFITDGKVICEILDHLGEPTSPPRLMLARGPPLWEVQDSGSETLDPQSATRTALRVRSAYRVVGHKTN